MTAMTYTQWAPDPALAAIIDCWWSLEADAGEGVQRVLPDGRPELIVHLRDPFALVGADGRSDRQAALVASGQLTTAIRLRPMGRTLTVGARLGAAAGRLLLGVPMRELTDRVVELAAVNPRLGIALRPAASAPSARDAARIIERALLRAIDSCPDPLTVQAVRVIDARQGQASIDEVCAVIGASRREVERRFALAVGVSPKFYSRITRFQRSVTALQSGDPSLLEAALGAGYYDQSHFNRDFVALAGVVPSTWMGAPQELGAYFTRAHRDGRGLSHSSKRPAPGCR